MTDDAPSDTLRERADESRWKLWLLMNADRRVVAGVLLLAVFLSLGVAAALAPGVADTLRNSDSVDTVFQGLLTATITGVTLVLTLNQLVLSQELGAVGDQRERMEGAMSFRDDAADLLEAPVAPARPAQFLRAFVQVAGERARDLRATVGDGSDAGRAVADLTDSLVGNADRVADSLDGATFGEFDVVAAALDFNYSWKVFAARRIDAEYGDDLTDEGRAALDRLTDVLRLFGPAREHFKTLYFQWELINLSRAILTAALPALVVSVFMVGFFDRTAYGVVAGVDLVVAAVLVGVVVAVAPFVILLAYVLRIATVTKHTLSIGPFILRETEGATEVEWDTE
ncbi:hypothetical protein [Halosegnis marinus]|uniref:Uncharacterized protein n=1 Tax=Halosegnis marinus TaxID=3034023 RepID=A0ABD5ZLW6_9EURY|nr:hypothetical protein [Halosegnis sp. DT85]